MTDNAKNKSNSVSHDQNFKNLILDYPVQSIRFFAEPEAEQCASDARIVPIRPEQLKDRLGDRFRELEVIDLYAGLSDEEDALYREVCRPSSRYKEGLMGLSQSFREEGWRERLIEGIELALSLKFGDESRNLAERIAQIKDMQRLKAVKEIIRSASDAEDFRRRLEY